MKKGGFGGSKTAHSGAKFEKSTLEDFLRELSGIGFSKRAEHISASRTVSGITLFDKTIRY